MPVESQEIEDKMSSFLAVEVICCVSPMAKTC